MCQIEKFFFFEKEGKYLVYLNLEGCLKFIAEMSSKEEAINLVTQLSNN